MENITLIHAWSIWFDGQSLEIYKLWNQPIIFWGRVGKVLQFMAAMTIIAEIIGPDAIREFGRSLRLIISFDTFKYIAKTPLRWVAHIDADDPSSELSVFELALFGFIKKYIIIIIAPLQMGTGVAFYNLWDAWWAFILGFLIGGLIPLVAVFIIMFIFSASLFTFLLIFDVLFLKGFAWLVDRRNLDSSIKLMSIIMLLIGFHFDLLAS